MNNYSAIIFDMDGVIFNTEEECLKCWIEIANKYNINNIKESYLLCVGTTYKKTKEIMLNYYGNDFLYDDYAKEASILFHKKYDDNSIPLKEGVIEILTYLKNINKKIALATSTKKDTVIKQLIGSDIYKYFDVIVCGDMVLNSKPAPDIYLKAIELLNINPKDAYAIEDSYNGIISAYNANLMPIMVPDLILPNDEMKSKSKIILNDLTKVIDYLKKN